MCSDVKEELGDGTSHEGPAAHIADGMFRYLIKCLFFAINPTIFAIQK